MDDPRGGRGAAAIRQRTIRGATRSSRGRAPSPSQIVLTRSMARILCLSVYLIDMAAARRRQRRSNKVWAFRGFATTSLLAAHL